jgi:hypothetical protein
MDDCESGLFAFAYSTKMIWTMSHNSRRKFVKTTLVGIVAAAIPLPVKSINIARSSAKLSLDKVREEVSIHLEQIHDIGGPYGSYRAGKKQRPDLYSSCDVAQMRTIWGENLSKSLSEEQRKEWVFHINSFADNSDGSYFDRFGHSALHANGMTIGALGVLGGKQKYPVKLYHEFNSPEKVVPWLEKIDWANQWGASHKFWGGMHCYSMSKFCSDEWLDVVFDWLNKNIDEKTGWWKKGIPLTDRHQALGGSVHILPIYQHKGREFPYPERVIDSVLALQLPNKRWLDRNRESDRAYMHYLELDALYALKYMRSFLPDYRKTDIHKAIFEYGINVIDYWKKEQERLLTTHPHRILSAIGTFGLLQHHLPEMFYDDVKWTDIFSDTRFYRTDLVEI